ncbi:MAG: acetamidase/formamidase family protein [Acidobacteria bacterium]|nr:acetamidase/formamidase family protein [Acidobacteriota bacterium]
MFRRALLSGVPSLLLANVSAAEIHRFTPTLGYQTYAVREPVLRIRPGDVVETHTLRSDFYTEKDGPWPGEVGPFYIEGATPEDTLVVKIRRLRPNMETGRSGTSGSFGVLTATHFTPMLHEPVPERRYIWKIDRQRLTATLDLPKSRMKRMEVALVPMLGRLATAPPGDQAISGGTPGDFGGNMDSSDAREGVTIYLPIFHPGAHFYYGDGHALQGDGELTGMGIETAMDVTFEFDLIKNKKIAWPRYENEEFIMVAGSVRPLIDAFRIAHVEMIKWLVAEHGFEQWEALEVFSHVGVARIANVVDPNFTVMAKFPKKYLPRGEPR